MLGAVGLPPAGRARWIGRFGKQLLLPPCAAERLERVTIKGTGTGTCTCIMDCTRTVRLRTVTVSSRRLTQCRCQTDPGNTTSTPSEPCEQQSMWASFCAAPCHLIDPLTQLPSLRAKASMDHRPRVQEEELGAAPPSRCSLHPDRTRLGSGGSISGRGQRRSSGTGGGAGQADPSKSVMPPANRKTSKI